VGEARLALSVASSVSPREIGRWGSKGGEEMKRASAVAAVVALVWAAAAAAGGSTTTTTSTHWAGYDVTGSAPFTDVRGSWTVPAVTCRAGAKNDDVQESSFWIGLDGRGSSTVEQTGTDADCNGSTPVYDAWWELYPSGTASIKSPVLPGDEMSAEVSASATMITITLVDATQGWTFTTKRNKKGYALASAEWIVEQFGGGQGLVPLANFGSATFSSASATGGGVTGPIGSFANTQIDMVSPTGSATTSAFNRRSGGFTVTWTG
jgi:hypothetical protein